MNGSFATTGYTLNDLSLTNITNDFEINFLISTPDGIVMFVLDPFSYSVDLGLLDAGDYSITANFYVDGILDNSINNNFTVSSVPLPAAAWLFLSGLFSIAAYGKISKKS